MRKMKLTPAIVSRSYSQAIRAYVRYTKNPTPSTRFKYVAKWNEYADRATACRGWPWLHPTDPFFIRTDWLEVMK